MFWVSLDMPWRSKGTHSVEGVHQLDRALMGILQLLGVLVDAGQLLRRIGLVQGKRHDPAFYLFRAPVSKV